MDLADLYLTYLCQGEQLSRETRELRVTKSQVRKAWFDAEARFAELVLASSPIPNIE